MVCTRWHHLRHSWNKKAFSNGVNYLFHITACYPNLMFFSTIPQGRMFTLYPFLIVSCFYFILVFISMTVPRQKLKILYSLYHEKILIAHTLQYHSDISCISTLLHPFSYLFGITYTFSNSIQCWSGRFLQHLSKNLTVVAHHHGKEPLNYQLERKLLHAFHNVPS